MATLVERLQRHGQGSIPLSDARQLMLWIYCSASVLPASLRGQAPTREELIAVFSDLADRGVIADAQSGQACATAEWGQLVDDLLSGSVTLDEAFFERAKAYLGA